jgi:hypothetical protein
MATAFDAYSIRLLVARFRKRRKVEKALGVSVRTRRLTLAGLTKLDKCCRLSCIAVLQSRQAVNKYFILVMNCSAGWK